MCRRERGFTLLELLVSMAIFAIISVLALGGLNTVVTQQQLARERMAEVVDLQRTMRFLTTDLAQLYPRYVRDELGQGSEAPLVADGLGEFIVRLSRGGWRNPARLPRGTLQRVQYRLDDDELLREYWPVVDVPLGMEPRTEVLIGGVDELLIEYLGTEDEWSETWPPLRQLGAGAPGRPRAARITLTVVGWGEIQRLVEMVP
jgi:general secretion pathway protein J